MHSKITRWKLQKWPVWQWSFLRMDYWDVFFDNKEDLKRAKEHQLERTITIFPWIAVIDKFQHWIYEHPQHTFEERTTAWMANS